MFMRVYWAVLAVVVSVGSEDDFSVDVDVDGLDVDAGPAPQRGLELARALLSTNKRRAALEVLIDEQVESYPMLMLRGELRSDVFGELDNAVTDFKRAVALQPNSADAWRRLGMAQLDSGGEAAASLAESLRLDPTDLGALHALERCSRQSAVVEIVTFATNETECGYRRLLKSAEYYGHTITNLAPKSQAWSNGLKLLLLKEHARSLPKDILLCAVDGYDVVLAGSSAQLASRYRQLTDGILVSADQTFYFVGERERYYAENYPPGAPYRFLNSGSLMGRAGDLAQVLHLALETYSAGWNGVSDQTLLHQLFVDHKAGIQLDHHQTAFANTGGRAFLRDLDVVQGRIHNRLTDTYPVVLHCPGQKRFRTEFDRLKKIGWDVDLVQCHDDDYDSE